MNLIFLVVFKDLLRIDYLIGINGRGVICKFMHGRRNLGLCAFSGIVVIAVGFLAMFETWLFTSDYFFEIGERFPGHLALHVLPTDLVLPLLIPWQVGVIGIGGTALAFTGFFAKGE